ncbi:uncharacterized protein LOC125027923 [Penaeus chinensis]|uniref:uncharacterized protein LOC125027923 n=1 Tax=Penaeus chinensis TaxID=139456 RepID=UPI001FB5C04C|nr:uncharacterized protein LOC125027923 [Penaeus chinensis]
MKHWPYALAAVGVLYVLTLGVMLRRFAYLFDSEELQLPAWTDTYLDEKALGLPWTNNQNAPILQYKPLGFNKTPKPTKQNANSANNDNLQYKPIRLNQTPRLTKETRIV